MHRSMWCAMALAVVMSDAYPARAQDTELSQIRVEIRQMKETYERRIEALEKRLAEAEAKAGKAEASAVKAESAAAQASSRPASQNAFNPAVSLVLQGTYANESQDPNAYQITGFVPSGGEVAPPDRGFSLGETELTIAANADPYFRGQATASLAPEGGVNTEEAYFQTLALPAGFVGKGGRFYSGLGYLNQQHQHAWDFQDAPLAYKAFLGGQLAQDGVQLKWIAPTDLLVELGVELSAGNQFPGSDQDKNGVGGSTFFGHIGGDIGASTAWRAGLSYLDFSPKNRSYDDVDAIGNPTVNSFTGTSKLWVADAILKWAPNGNSTVTNFKLQGEYFRSKENGQLTYDDSGGSDTFGSVTGPFNGRQSGWYLQGIYQFIRQWRLGYRYDALNYGTLNNGIVQNGLGPTASDFPVLAPHSPTRNTVMLDWSPSEFSRVRFQYASDKSRIGATDNEFFVQYIYSLGAHGAHAF
jgi:hypothetical protein